MSHKCGQSCLLVPSLVISLISLSRSLLEVPVLTCFYPSTAWLAFPLFPLTPPSPFLVSFSSPISLLLPILTLLSTSGALGPHYYTPSFSSLPSLCAETQGTEVANHLSAFSHGGRTNAWKRRHRLVHCVSYGERPS